MAEDKKAVEKKVEEAAPAPAPSMFTRKGIAIMIIFMTVEAILIIFGLQFIEKKIEKQPSQIKKDKSGIGKTQLELGMISITMPAKDADSIRKDLSFKVWFRVNLDEKAQTKEFTDFTGMLNDDVKRHLRQKIGDKILAVDFQQPMDFAQPAAKTEVEKLVHGILEEGFVELMQENEKFPDGSIVHSVLLEDWMP